MSFLVPEFRDGAVQEIDSKSLPAARGTPRVGLAWMGLTVALAVHVTDEALTDFLSIYNPIAQSIRETVPWVPLPIFEFTTWLTALIGAVVALLALSHFAFRGARPLRALAYVFSILMALKALAHSVGLLVLGRPMPGVYSSPFLFAAAVFLLHSLLQSRLSRRY